MPELPEVECVCRHLKQCLQTRTIKNVRVNYSEMLEENSEDFKNKLIGRTILDVYRIGKFIIFKLDNSKCLLTHLRMEGKFFFEPSNSIDNPHIHVVFNFDDYDLYYQDTRKFGRMYIRDEETMFLTHPLNLVGPDPFIIKDNNYTALENIYSKIISKKKPIKETLLDQSIISGLGNIYVDEVLFRTNISPFRSSKDITIDELKELIDVSCDVFKKSIALGGTTIKSFTSSKNHIGHYQDYLLVHTKFICPKCGNKLNIVRLGGRSTYYCEVCQE